MTVKVSVEDTAMKKAVDVVQVENIFVVTTESATPLLDVLDVIPHAEDQDVIPLPDHAVAAVDEQDEEALMLSKKKPLLKQSTLTLTRVKNQSYRTLPKNTRTCITSPNENIGLTITMEFMIMNPRKCMTTGLETTDPTDPMLMGDYVIHTKVKIRTIAMN
jgi:hypothetical protein